MHFAVSGVQCPLWLPPLVAFVVALLTTPAGISGAFLLLPFQMSVLGFVSPAVTPTNLVYNVVAVPGGLWRFMRERRMDWRLAGAVVAGTAPGVILGAIVRVRYLPDPRYIRLFVAAVLLYLAVRLLRQSAARRPLPKPGGALFPCTPHRRRAGGRAGGRHLWRGRRRHHRTLRHDQPLPSRPRRRRLRPSPARSSLHWWASRPSS